MSRRGDPKTVCAELGSGARSERSGPMVTGGRNWERKDLKDLERV
jgi:hypothetical protein